MTAIGGLGQQRLEHRARALERAHGLEQRHDIERHLPALAVRDVGPAREKQDRQHVVRRFRSAHDVVADGALTVSVAALHHRLEHGQCAAADCVESPGRSAVARYQLAERRASRLGREAGPVLAAEALGDDLAMHGGVLPHVEGRKVEAKGERPAQQPLDREQARVPTVVVAQARRDELDVTHELVRRFVVVWLAVVRRAEPFANLREEDAIGHPVVACRREFAGPRQQDVVFRDPCLELAARAHTPGALR